MSATIETLISQLQDNAWAHGLRFRCPSCNAGVGKWCIGNERKAGPTDANPSCASRLVLAAKP